MAYLEIHRGRTIVHAPLTDVANAIGRHADNAVVVNDRGVSRHHCVIEQQRGGFVITDRSSRHGTLVNGERVTSAALRGGDVINLGGAVLRFVDASMPRIAAPQEAAATSRAGRSRVGAIFVWALAAVVSLMTVAVVLWSVGLVEVEDAQRLVHSWRERLLVDSTDSASHAQSTNEADTSEPAQPQSEAMADEELESADAMADERAAPPGAVRTRIINSTMTSRELEGLLGQQVSGRFIGRPIRDDRGRLTWELPPDGVVVAVLAPADDAAREVLEAIENEPSMLAVELTGRLMRDARSGGFVVRVGRLELMQALSGSGATLQEATRRLVGQPVVVNPAYVARPSG